jgi:tRNA dimethylallyltransferase
MIHPNHSSRLERALEVRLTTGESIRSFWTEGSTDLKIDGQKANLAVLALIPEDRERLKARLNRRFDSMLDRGFIEEVQSLRMRPGLTDACSSMRSVGYRQIWQYLDNEISKTEMREQAQAATRHLAKRQLTWLRSWRADSNTLMKVSNMLPVAEGKTWLSKVLDRVL